MGISAAADEATRLRGIGFAEFTTDLVLKVFDGLVAAHLSQTEAYLQLVQALSKTLKDYVNDTHDQIGGDEVLAFLSVALKDAPDKENKLTGGTALMAADATAINGKLALATTDGGMTPPTVTPPPAVALAGNQVAQANLKANDATILEAVARRIAANKYDLLREMVKLGLLRLVVTHGLVETKLTFSTFVSDYYVKNSTSYNSSQFNFNAKAETGWALAKWIKASAAANYGSVTVRTTNETQQDYSSSQVNIFGHVRIEFKTDFQPLSS
jgi:hypothetical protein